MCLYTYRESLALFPLSDSTLHIEFERELVWRIIVSGAQGSNSYATMLIHPES